MKRTVRTIASMAAIMLITVFQHHAELNAAPDTSNARGHKNFEKHRGMSGSELKILMRSDIVLRAGDADIYSPFAPAVKSFTAEGNTPASVVFLPASPYDAEIFNLSRRHNDYAIIVANREIGQELITRGLVIPLDKLIRKMPRIVEDMPVSEIQKFARKGRHYGIPIGNKGALLEHAYMVLRSVRRGGRMGESFRLIEHLKDAVPLAGLPDLIVDNVFMETVSIGPGSSEFVTNPGAITDAVPGSIMVKIEAVISNVGEMPAETFEVKISIGKDETYAATGSIEYLGAGDKYELHVEIEIPAPGGDISIDDLQPLNVDVDTFGEVLEMHDFNNSLSRYNWNEEWIDLSIPEQPVSYYSHFVIENDIMTSGNSGSDPKVAFDGTNFLVVWARLDPEDYNPNWWNYTLRGKLLDQNGITLHEFDVATAGGHYSHFNIGFDGTDYFVVWSRRFWQSNGTDPNAIIEGTAITTQGVVLHDPPLVIEDRDLYGWPDRISHQSPDIIFDGQNFLITYVSNIQAGDANHWEDPAGIYARQVTPAWSVSSQSVPIYAFDTLRSYWWAHQRTDFLDHKALLAFHGLRSEELGALTVETGIYTIWMDVDPVSGTPFPDLPILLDGDYDENHFPHGSFEYPVVQASENAKFLTAWSAEETSPLWHSDIMRSFAQGLNSGWGYFNPEAPITQGGQDRFPALAYSGEMFTVAFQYLEGCKTYLAAANVNQAGSTSNPLVFYSAGDLVNQVDIAYGTSVGLIVYEFGDGIWGQFITLPSGN